MTRPIPYPESIGLTQSELFDKVWSTPKGQALALYGSLGLRRTAECGGPPKYTNARLKALQARAYKRYERRRDATVRKRA